MDSKERSKSDTRNSEEMEMHSEGGGEKKKKGESTALQVRWKTEERTIRLLPANAV